MALNIDHGDVRHYNFTVNVQFYYVGRDDVFWEYLASRSGDIGLDLKQALNESEYIKLLEQDQEPIFLYDLENPTIEKERFFELQNLYFKSPINIGLMGDNQAKEVGFILVFKKSLYEAQNLKFFCEILITNRERIETFFHTFKTQKDLIDNLPLGMYRTTREGDFLFGNPELLNILEVPNFDILTRLKASEFYVNKEDRKRWIELINQRRVVKNFEFQLRTFKGNTKWVRNNARGIFQKDELLFIEGFLNDVTEEKILKEKEARIIEKTLEQKLFLIDILRNRTDLLERNLEDTFGELLEKASKILEADRLGLWLKRDDERDEIYHNIVIYEKGTGFVVSQYKFNFKEHFRYLNFLSKGIQISSENILKETRIEELFDSYLRPAGVKALIDTPIFVRQKLVGILKCEYKEHRELGRLEEWFNHILALLISNWIESRNILQSEEKIREYANKLEKLIDEVISLLSSIVEERDPYTAGHSKRVALIAIAIAKELGYDEARIRKLYYAGLLHDIGKLFVPAEILTKPAKLTPIEYDIVKVHPQKGYEVLIHTEFLKDLAEIVVQHHERLDGSGYPYGLKNSQILEDSKILAVADVAEAMLARRPYRPPISLQEVLKYLEENKGKLFDPKVVGACKKIFMTEESFKINEN